MDKDGLFSGKTPESIILVRTQRSIYVIPEVSRNLRFQLDEYSIEIFRNFPREYHIRASQEVRNETPLDHIVKKWKTKGKLQGCAESLGRMSRPNVTLFENQMIPSQTLRLDVYHPGEQMSEVGGWKLPVSV